MDKKLIFGQKIIKICTFLGILTQPLAAVKKQICHGDAILYIRFYVYKAEIKEAAHRIEIRKHNSILEQPLFCLLSDFVGTKNFKYFIDMLLSHLRNAVARRPFLISNSPFLHSLSHTTHRVQLNCKLNKYLSTWNSNSVKSVSPYEILGLPTTAQPQEIDIAYRKLLMKVHPDHGGSTEAFLRVKQAREVLIAQSNPDLEIKSSGGIRKKSFAQRFNDAVKSRELDQAWSLWSIVLANNLHDEPVTLEMCETYLQLLTQSSVTEKKQHQDTTTEGVIVTRWEGLLVAMDAFQVLRENGQFQNKEAVEENVWNGLLWHLAQLPRDEEGGSLVMNDILTVCKRMDMLNIQQDQELLRTQIFMGRT